MDDKLARQIAGAMECTPELLPYLPELLADLEELGASRRVILNLLRPLGLPPGARVLDLGCGKGAVLLALAEELGLTGLGVDAFPPFIEAAQQSAQSRGLAGRVEFRSADLRDAARNCKNFDVAMMLSLGAAIGPPDEIVALLRPCVRPSGYLVIDDAVLGPGVTQPVPGYEGYAGHDDALSRLLAHGDRLLHEHIYSQERRAQEIRAETEKIRRRADHLARHHPESADLLRAYVERQEREAELARTAVFDVTWLLQRR